MKYTTLSTYRASPAIAPVRFLSLFALDSSSRLFYLRACFIFAPGSSLYTVYLNFSRPKGFVVFPVESLQK